MGCGNCRGISKFGATLVVAALFSPFSSMSVPAANGLSRASPLDSCLDHLKAGLPATSACARRSSTLLSTGIIQTSN
jgi:hypothetical protein